MRHATHPLIAKFKQDVMKAVSAQGISKASRDFRNAEICLLRKQFDENLGTMVAMTKKKKMSTTIREHVLIIEFMRGTA